MNRIKGFLLCLVLLLLTGILHHVWSRMTGQSLLATPARAANLSNAFGETCNGTATWHFVNNQTGGSCDPTMIAVFSCNGGQTAVTGNLIKCNSSNAQYNVTTTGNCTLNDASTGDQPGRLVLSDFTCSPTPTPTPTPTPSPTPTPTP